MVRFIMSECDITKSERIKLLNAQFDEFLTSNGFREYLNILNINSCELEEIYEELKTYNTRKGADGQIRESQVAPLNEVLEANRETLFPLYKEFGLVDINKPLNDAYRHIVVLGGSANANFDRVEAAKRLASDTVSNVTALSCFRPIPPGEMKALKKEDRKGAYETEFGSLDMALNMSFDMQEYDDGVRRFDYPRNINLAYRIKTYKDPEGRTIRLFASPSKNIDARASTYDTCVHFLDNTSFKEGERILLITNNQYCNYQFLTFLVALLESDKNITFDIVGCSDDDHLVNSEKYNTNQFFGDILSELEWIIRFKTEFTVIIGN